MILAKKNAESIIKYRLQQLCRDLTSTKPPLQAVIMSTPAVSPLIIQPLSLSSPSPPLPLGLSMSSFVAHRLLGPHNCQETCGLPGALYSAVPLVVNLTRFQLLWRYTVSKKFEGESVRWCMNNYLYYKLDSPEMENCIHVNVIPNKATEHSMAILYGYCLCIWVLQCCAITLIPLSCFILLIISFVHLWFLLPSCFPPLVFPSPWLSALYLPTQILSSSSSCVYILSCFNLCSLSIYLPACLLPVLV